MLPLLAAELADTLPDAAGVDASLASMAQLKPWLVANLLLSIKLDRQGFRRDEGVEQVLLAQARRRGVRVVSLESADLQLALFDSMSDIEAERYLRDTLAGLADGSALERARRIIEAWRAGNAAALDALLADAVDGRSEVADFTPGASCWDGATPTWQRRSTR